MFAESYASYETYYMVSQLPEAVELRWIMAGKPYPWECVYCNISCHAYLLESLLIPYPQLERDAR